LKQTGSGSGIFLYASASASTINLLLPALPLPLLLPLPHHRVGVENLKGKNHGYRELSYWRIWVRQHFKNIFIRQYFVMEYFCKIKFQRYIFVLNRIV
jgi:hypothetical protein